MVQPLWQVHGRKKGDPLTMPHAMRFNPSYLAALRELTKEVQIKNPRVSQGSLLQTLTTSDHPNADKYRSRLKQLLLKRQDTRH